MATKHLGLEPPLIVIAGPTASGKTALAISLATQFGGEIICADSRTIYRGMDIGTAKPTIDEQRVAVHWGLDLVEPGEYFTAADFKQYATEKVAEIRRRGRIPFLVGGTGLYVDAVLFDFQFGPRADAGVRHDLGQNTIEELQLYCKENNIALPENFQNKRYLIRAIERKSISDKRETNPVPNTIIVGITTEKNTLRTRIELRSEQLFDNGVVEEATDLGKKYGWESEAMTGNIYPLVRQYQQGILSRDELQEQFVVHDWRLAKRQLTWLRRNPYILWGTTDDSEHYLTNYLANR